ncbi:MAG: hypothetical protein CVU90_10415 [Firmicutes bacterium HGW-Firmicutes-15]|nr:MAG: hypothetical protein CVU90_10415 [Firmicutes bacterium HGW-Firmicutes-15]
MPVITAQEALSQLISKADNSVTNLEVSVNSRALSAEEAIGHPERQDYPLIRGKEVLLQAEIQGSIGQAFTGDPIPFDGTIDTLLKTLSDRPGHQALAVAVLNALAKKMGITSNTIHCVNNEPEECGQYISEYLFSQHGACNVGIIGYQPALLEHCKDRFGVEHVHITDLNPDIIGELRYGVEVWDGLKDTPKLVETSDVLLITGTILANGTFTDVIPEIGNKPYYFFGTTCAALAAINGANRLCPMSK